MGYKVKRIMVGDKQVRPSRTFTISWTEKSDMSSGWTYSDDAVGLTAGSGDFDEFFGYSGVRLSAAGVETDEVTQEDSGGNGKLDITQLGTLTSGDNVMIKFPVRGIKMSKSGSVVTLSITDKPNADGYQYYAHSTGTLSNPGTLKSNFYLGAYKAYSNSNVLKSWSGKSPTVNTTQANFCTYAKANGSGYNIEGFYQRMYILALYIMKYGNPNSQSVVGMGYVGGSSTASTGATNGQTNATYGTSSTTVQSKLFGLEDFWGNTREYIGGCYTNSSKVLYTQLSGYSGTASGGESTGTTLTHTGSSYCLSSIAGNNKAMFGSIGTSSGYTNYYCDACYIGSGLGVAGGYYSDNTDAGIFNTQIFLGESSTSAATGTRLMYL